MYMYVCMYMCVCHRRTPVGRTGAPLGERDDSTPQAVLEGILHICIYTGGPTFQIPEPRPQIPYPRTQFPKKSKNG